MFAFQEDKVVWSTLKWRKNNYSCKEGGGGKGGEGGEEVEK